MVVEWGSLAVNWWTHTIGELHMNDFILAARCEELAAQ
ncbi:MAG: 4a-hydroxytetrahydrobiopterin dehydratase [Pseudomonadales bacterium]|jgi:4a-hydroxytetrahydrobiopterin dehydratase